MAAFLLAYGIALMLWPLIPLSILALYFAVEKLLMLPQKEFGDFVKNMGYAIVYGAAGTFFTSIWEGLTGSILTSVAGVIAAVFLMAIGLYLVFVGTVLCRQELST